MARIVTIGGDEFDSLDEESILDAARRAGVQLAYSCRTGRCSTCKVRIEVGETEPLHAEAGLEQDETDDGWVLSCVRTARSDLLIEAGEDTSGLRLPTPRTYPCRIAALERLSADVIGVRLRLPPTANFTYRAGQHVEVLGPSGVRRAYSLACAPRADATLELQIVEYPGGQLSDYWFGSAQPGDLLRLYGPLGTFVLRDYGDAPVIFLATGTGAAPVRAMLQEIAAGARARGPVTVYWGARFESGFYLDSSEMALDGAHLVQVLSQPSADWRGTRGYVQDALMADSSDLAGSAVYACGSEAMVHDSRALLGTAGLDPHRFFADAFVSSAP